MRNQKITWKAAALASGVLAMISGASIAQLSKEDLAKESLVGLENAHHVGIALLMYSNDYDQVMPYVNDTETVQAVVRPYLEKAIPETKAERDKAYKEAWSTHNPSHSDFLFNIALGGVMQADVPRPADTVLVYESRTWPNGSRIVTFADGHTKKVTDEGWVIAGKTLTQRFKRWAKKPLHYDRAWLKELSAGG